MKYEYLTKLSAYLSKLPAEKRRQEIAKCLLSAKGIKRKRREETDVSLPWIKCCNVFEFMKNLSLYLLQEASASTKKLKLAISGENELSGSSGEEEPSTPPDVGSKEKAIQMDISGSKSSPITVDSSDESEDSDDVALLQKKQISSPKSTEESSEEETEASDSEPEQSMPPK